MRFRDAPASPRRFDRRGRFLSGSERGVVLPDPFDPIAYINTPRWQTSRLGLGRIADLLERMGRPQDDLKFVHVAGTNGKGSVCSYVAQVLTCAGYRTGLFTSPYIETFEERIRVDGENISLPDLTRATLAVREHACAMEAETGDHPTEFELMTAVALEHFRAARCDIVVLEVGLGGRLDSTNVIDAPEVSVIARIGLDHTALLGDTLAAVAGEKVGIVKLGSPVVSWPQEPEAMEAVERAAQRACSELRVPDFAQLEIEPLACAGGASVSRETFVRSFRYRGERFTTQLLGRYQPANAALAIEVVATLRKRGWAISDEALRAGIALTRWPGRFEVAGARPLTIIDGGHNPQGAAALADSLRDLLGGAGRAQRRVVFVMGVLADKDYAPMIDAVLPFARAFVTYAPENPRALAAEDLAAAIRARIANAPAPAEAPHGGASDPVDGSDSVPEPAAADPADATFAPTVLVAADPAAATKRARTMAGPDGVVVAFGSLYSIASVRSAIS